MVGVVIVEGSHILDIDFDDDGLTLTGAETARFGKTNEVYGRFFHFAGNIRRGDVDLDNLFARDVTGVGNFDGDIEFFDFGRAVSGRGIEQLRRDVVGKDGLVAIFRVEIVDAA